MIVFFFYTYLPTFLLVLKEEEEEEEEDVEEVKLYDFDWTVPPETNNTDVCTLVIQLLEGIFYLKINEMMPTYCLFSVCNWPPQQCCVMICSHYLNTQIQ